MRWPPLCYLFLTLHLASCQKQPETPAQTENPVQTETQMQQHVPLQQTSTELTENPTHQQLQQNFDQADQQLTSFLNHIENPKTSTAVRQHIICHDYAQFYQSTYMPALLALSPHNTDKKQMLSELHFILDDYQLRYGVSCPA